MVWLSSHVVARGGPREAAENHTPELEGGKKKISRHRNHFRQEGIHDAISLKIARQIVDSSGWVNLHSRHLMPSSISLMGPFCALFPLAPQSGAEDDVQIPIAVVVH